MANKNYFKIFTLMFLTLSLSLIIPYQFGEVYGADTSNTPDVDDTTTQAQAAKSCSLVPPLNPKDSLLMSIVTLCLPGVLEKAKEWKEIKCEQVVCSYEAVKNSLSPGFCAKESGYKVCTFVVGELFALPPMSIVEKIKDLIASVIANPVGYTYAVAIGVLRESVGTTHCYEPSGIGAVILGLNDIASGTQELQQIIDNGFSFETDSEDYCSQMSDIVEELEGVVAAGAKTPTPTPTETNTTA